MNAIAESAGVDSHGLRNVISASDLTDDSDAALQAAAYLATAETSRLHLFHCVPRPVFPYWKGVVEPETRESWLREARVDLERQYARVLFGDAPPAEVAVAFGSPSIEIGRFASGISADVIVLGAHQPRAALDDLLGTTADRVLRTSRTPCLLIHRPFPTPLATVLVATDFSPPARLALETVVDWLSEPGVASSDPSPVVEILHVSAFLSRRQRPLVVNPLLDREVEMARRRLPDPSAVAIRSRVLSAPLESEGIATACEQVQPDLIVLGTHGHGFVARALLGSTASTVARTVRHPLLMVPLADPGGSSPSAAS